MKNLKLYENMFQSGSHKDEDGIEKHVGKPIDVDNELFEAFRRYLVNTAGINLENITGIDAYNKYVVISTKNDDPVRIEFTKRYNV
jgi:hypothetical protein